MCSCSIHGLGWIITVALFLCLLPRAELIHSFIHLASKLQTLIMFQAQCLVLGLRVIQTDEKIPAPMELTVSRGGSWRET